MFNKGAIKFIIQLVFLFILIVIVFSGVVSALTDYEIEKQERAELYDDGAVTKVIEKNSADILSACDGNAPGMANPASLYCLELGYGYWINIKNFS